jgi:hypothetical protein
MSVEIALQSTLVSGDHSGAPPNVASCAIHVKATFGRQCPSNHSPHSCYTDNAVLTNPRHEGSSSVQFSVPGQVSPKRQSSQIQPLHLRLRVGTNCYRFDEMFCPCVPFLDEGRSGSSLLLTKTVFERAPHVRVRKKWPSPRSEARTFSCGVFQPDKERSTLCF